MFDQIIGNPFAAGNTLLHMDVQVADKLITEGQAALPYEYSALLAGHDSMITMHLPAPRSESTLRTFAWSGPSLLTSLRIIREADLKWLGVFHTHPTTPAVPSSADLAGWHYPTLSYWIASLLRPSEPELRSYQLVNGRFVSIPFSLKNSIRFR